MTRPKVLLTGASSGIGAGIARLLAESGYDVCGTYFQHAERADALRSALARTGAVVEMVHADLSSPELDAGALIRGAAERLGGLDALVNCAAEVSSIPFAEVTRADFDRVMAANLRAPFFLSQAASEARRQNLCRLAGIVNVSSVSERYAWPGLSVYEASKAGLSMLTRSLAFELAGSGVRVNAVAPGAVEVERALADPGWGREIFERIVPLKRPGEPDDVAQVVCFLLSDAARYVTGQVIYVDGGLSLRL